MGSSEGHITSDERVRYDIVLERFKEIFPRGNEQVEEDLDAIQQMIDSEVDHEGLRQTYFQALGEFYRRINKEDEADIEKGVINTVHEFTEGQLKQWEAREILDHIRSEYLSEKEKSLQILSERFGCPIKVVRQEFVRTTDLKRKSKEELRGMIQHYRNKRVEEAHALGINNYDVPACFLEKWTVREYLEMFGNGDGIVEIPTPFN